MAPATPLRSSRSTRTGHVLLWAIQILLALLFLFAGVMKLTMPTAALAQMTGLPGAFMKFIAVSEALGALGLVLPGLLRIGRGLTPVAAVGLVTIMAGATTLTVANGPAAPALLPAAVGILAALVARGRRRWAHQLWLDLATRAWVATPVQGD